MSPLRLTLFVFLAGCGPVTATVHTRAFDSSAVPQNVVQVYLAGDSIPESCVAVADLHASRSTADLKLIIADLRDSAGKLGANTVQVRAVERPGDLEAALSGLAVLIGGIGGSAGDDPSDVDARAVAFHCPTS